MTNLGMVVSRFNYQITGEMEKRAIQRAKELNVTISKTLFVPGSFEVPLAVSKLLEDKKIEGVITIGTIIKGGTDHDMVIAHSVANKLLELSIKHRKPISLGISGPNVTWQQSEKRIEEYAIRAVDSTLGMINEFKKLKQNL